MSYILETERLRLREFTLADTDLVLRLLNSPGWLEFIGDRNVKSETQAIEYLKNGPFKSYQAYGYGFWLVEKKEDEQAIGACGLLNRENLDSPDIGYAFLPAYSGCGYACETATRVLDYAFETLMIPKIYGICKPHNMNSIRLLEKLDLTFTDFYYLPDSQEKSLLYTLENVGRPASPKIAQDS